MYADLIQENATVTGTGPITLAGNVTGWRKFSDAFGSGKKVRYFIQNETRLQWEAGEGTFTVAGPDVLSRDKVVRSSNGNNLVNFDDSAKIVICSADADTIRFGAGSPSTASGTADARTVTHDPPVTVLRDGMRVRFRNGAAANATTSPTLKIDDTDAIAWRLRDGAQPVAGDYAANAPMEVEYHEASNQWRLTFDLKAQMLATISPASLSASQNDWNPTGLSGAGAIRVTSSNDIDITGLTAVGDTRLLWIHNANASGGKTITLKDESSSSTGANRFALVRDLVLSPEESAALQYDATTQRWRAAGDIAGSGGGSETITAGESLADRDLIYQDMFNQRGNGATRWYKVDADATAPVRISPRLGIALAAISSGADGEAQVRPGRVAGFTSLTAGGALWASATAGALTQTAPSVPSSGTQIASRLVGVAASTTEIEFEPDDDTTFVTRNSALAVDSGITIEHWPDAGAAERIPNAYLVQTSSTSLVSGATGTAIGNMSGGGGLAAAFNGSNDSSTGGAVLSSGSGDATCGKDWGSGNTKKIGRFRIRAPSDSGDFASGGGTAVLKLQGSTDNFASSVVDLYTGATGAPGAGAYTDVTSGIDTSTAYRYHRVTIGTAGGGNRRLNELEFYETSAARDEKIGLGSYTIDAAATNLVTTRFDDGAGANASTKSTFVNRTGATRDIAAEIVL